MDTTVSSRLPDALVKDLARFSKETGMSRSETMREVVAEGLRVARLRRALEAYRRREATLEGASKMAGIPLEDFLGELPRAGVVLNYDVDELRHDREVAAGGA